MKKFGLLGEKLGHSYSPQIHSMMYENDYELYEKKADELDAFFENCPLNGFNVTIPYKKAVIKYLSSMSDTAKKIGSVNTIIKTPNGFEGYNTDYYGFEFTVKKLGINPKGKKVLVLGSGGAAQTVICYFKNENAEDIVVISRQGKNNYNNINRHFDADIIVNCTPVGMYPNNGISPIDLEGFKSLEGIIDLIYNPADTELLLKAKAKNIPCINGLYMLVAQAKKAAEIFLNKEIDNSEIERITKAISNQMKNIVLIGMPGCGKSSVGKILADKLNRDFYDADQYFEQKHNISIPEFFKAYGEEKFRLAETEILKELCQKTSSIISTGGGAVTVPLNYNLIKQNSTVFLIERDLKLLVTDGRPLSQANPVEQIYKKRKLLYEKFADFKVENMSTPELCAEEIIKITEEL